MKKPVSAQSLKPVKVLVALVMLNGILALMSIVFPEEGIRIGDNFKLKFPSLESVFFREDEVVVSMDSVLKDVVPVEDSTGQTNDSSQGDIRQKISTEIKSSINYDSESGKLKNLVSRSIQFPDTGKHALDYFLRALVEESPKKVIRILHYGDSQLEGDRVTDYLRNRLQMLFGGEGPGIVLPLEPTAGWRRTVKVEQSRNFSKEAIYKPGFHNKDRRYGIGTAVFTINGETKDLIGYDTAIVQKVSETDSSILQADTTITPLYRNTRQSTAYISASRLKSAFQRVQSYSRITLLYSNDEPYTVEVIREDSMIYRTTITPAENGMFTWDLPVRKQVSLAFVEGKFPTVYAMALDGKNGVAVDNFPMRGSSAQGFEGMDLGFYGTQLKAMNVKLIILQFGVNVIPGVLEDYSHYRLMFRKQLLAIKKAYPEVSILIIGPSDMSMNKDGKYVSYPNIPLIRDAMRSAAFSSGCAFWDLYEAMGGENSMAAWVKAGYAHKDYTHFSFKGSRFVGEMIFEALLEQIQNRGYIN